MNFSPPIIQSLVLLGILLVAIFLAYWGNRKHNNNVVILGLVIIVAVFVYTLYTEPQLQVFLNSASTVALVLVALFALLESRESRKLIRDNEGNNRQERITKELRDSKERFLNEIIEWSYEIFKCGLNTDMSLARIDDKTLFSTWSNNLVPIADKATYIKEIAAIFSEDIVTLARNAETALDELKLHFTHLAEDSNAINQEEITQFFKNIREPTVELLKKSTEIKISLLHQANHAA